MKKLNWLTLVGVMGMMGIVGCSSEKEGQVSEEPSGKISFQAITEGADGNVRTDLYFDVV